ncbi:MAG: hypothetical protein IPK67_20550 [Planctomycetes bacterium]|nr:hypothetical protein [Planctomycetota bacterium]
MPMAARVHATGITHTDETSPERAEDDGPANLARFTTATSSSKIAMQISNSLLADERRHMPGLGQANAC